MKIKESARTKLKEMRLDRHLSQEEVARALSVSQQTVSRYERDIYSIPVDMLILFAKYYEVSTDYLLGMTDKKWRMDKDREVETKELCTIYDSMSHDDRKLVRELLARLVDR